MATVREQFNLPPEGVEFKDQPDMVNNEGFTWTQPETINYNGDILQARADKYQRAFGFDYQDIIARLTSGDETNLQERGTAIAKMYEDIARRGLAGMGKVAEAAQPYSQIDPRTVMENEFGGQYASSLPSFFSPAANAKFNDNPEQMDNALADSARAFSHKEVLSSVYQKWLPRIQERTIMGSWKNAFSSSDTAELLVPFLSWYRWGDSAKKFTGQGYWTTSSNKEELLANVLKLPPDQMKEAAEKILSDLYDKNAYEAAGFLSALDSYTTSDRYWDNIGDALNFPGVAAWRYAYRKVASFVRPQGINEAGVAEAVGNISRASKEGARATLAEAVKAENEFAQLKAITKNTVSIADPDSIIVSTPQFSKRAAERVKREITDREELFTNLMTDIVNVKRLDTGSPALQVAFEEAEQRARQYLKNWSSSVMDVRYIDSDTFKVSNTPMVELKVGTPEKPLMGKINVKSKDGQLLSTMETAIGKTDSTFFDSIEQAQKHATDWYGFKKGTYSIVEEAPEKFYISVRQHIDETTPRVQQALIETSRGQDPNDWTSIALRKFGSSENLMDNSMSANRKITVFGLSNMLDKLAKELNALQAPLNKESRAKFRSFINSQRDYERPGGDVLGKYSKNQGEFEADWLKQHKTFPTEAESQAYWNYVNINDWDYIIRNTNRYNEMSQAGWNLLALDTKAFRMKQPLIEGKIITQIPVYKDWPARVLRWEPDGTMGFVNQREQADLIALGYKIVQLHPEGFNKLRSIRQLNIPQEGFDYILTRNVQQGPLDFNRVAYNTGGHRVYIDDWFASGELVRRVGTYATNIQFTGNRYSGDFNVSSHMIRGQAEEFIRVFNTARELLRAGKDAELKSYIEKNFPSSLNEERFRKLYAEEGLNIDQPLRLRRKDKSLYDSYDLKSIYPNLLRDADNPHHLGTALEDTAYVGRRDARLPSYTFEGTPHNPVVRIGQSRLLDALPALQRTLSQNAGDLYTGDMKIKHARDFMARYGDLLDIPSDVDGLLDPVKHTLYTPFKAGLSDSRLAAAQNYRKTISNFFDLDYVPDLEIRTFRDRALETIYNRFGLSAAEMADNNFLNKSGLDPVKFLRGSAFHTMIGLFNPASFMTQAMQFSTTLGIAGPVRTAEALAWAQYARLMRKASPEIQEVLARKAGEWGGNANDFKDYYDALKRSGILTVRGESVYLDDDKVIRVGQSALGKFLDWGTIPFQQGEKLSRTVAFQIAFREWRASVGNSVKVSDDAIRQIVGRTDDLLSNMTRASVMSWQNGFANVPTQFFNWHMRMTEQMLGSRLTTAEKSRLVLTNSILFGLPAGVATAGLTAIVPWHSGMEQLRNILGVPSNDPGTLNKTLDVVLKGGVSTYLKYMTGDSFNAHERFGPGKNPLWDLITNDDKGFFAVISGAAGKTIQDFVKLSYPLVGNIAARVNGTETTPLGLGDFQEQLNNVVSSMGAVERLIAGLNTGKYLSKNDRYLIPTDDFKSWITFFTGLQPQALQEAQSKKTYIDTIKSFQKAMEPAMRRLHTQMYEAGEKGDLDSMDKLEKRLKAMYIATGMNDKEILDFEKLSFRSMNESMLDSVNRKLQQRNERQYHRVIKEQSNARSN